MAALTTHRIPVRLGPVVRRVKVAAIPRLAIGELAAAALCLSISAGALSVVSSISGAGVTTSQGGAALSVGRPLSATSAALASSTGDLAVARGLNASTLAVAQTAGTLQVANGISGASSATSQAAGALSVQRNLTAAANAQSASTGAISATVSPSASTTAQSTSAGSVTVERSLAGSAAALSVTSAVLTVSKGFDGASAATSTTAGGLTVARPVGASTSALSVTAAALTVTKGLSATTSAPAVAGGTLTAGGGEDADAAAYLNAQTTPPSSTERSLVDALVRGLKTDGVWAKIDRLSLLAAETAQAARLCLRNPAKSMAATNLTASSFAASRGYTGDIAATGFLDFGEPYLNGASMFQQDSASVFVWCNNAVSPVVGTGTGRVPQVGNTGSARVSINVLGAAGNNTWQVNVSTATAYTGSGNRSGFRCAVRPTSANQQVYTNGQLVSDISSASSTPSTTNGCSHRSAATYGDDRLAVIGYGAALTATDVANLNTRLNTYLTAKGAA
ncbi:hypothetical protein [Methylobacterium flocculans]|uniref:hypothetical protein n=1 Tax=Methylobacterium flocculans TaxID=2984843 RepID=UPI0021F35311|nr:hypothetical protein [Methylobacterium sp. FF17]